MIAVVQLLQLLAIVVLFTIFLYHRPYYVFGLYRHYKGGWYLGLCRSWESDNDAQRVRRVLYWSFKEWQLDDRTESEFLSTASLGVGLYELKSRFERILPRRQPIRRLP